MNKVVLVGRLTRDPEVRYSQGENATAVARYTVAVDRRFKRDNEPTADFIPCVVFGRSAEFAEKYFRQGMRVSISGRIQTGSYTNKEGVKVYTTEVIVEDQEFAESKAESEANRGSFNQAAPSPTPSVDAGDGFMNIPDGIDEELPFN
ncbi:single-stranded DNA-binding protein [Clostridium sp. C105KSO13]|uniref:single-stranded DNA-binding protein n=1 Tax=Clostridium sp. C105KSO13 TaxID=1776045 RepID=UPI00074075B4|nr:single-stranded DNA-binding protein [Clostridium sp. C105KSO13]CUX21474.1 Single-stranded DNA-binding protein ssb [Clostridium sp. C105KSO13]